MILSPETVALINAIVWWAFLRSPEGRVLVRALEGVDRVLKTRSTDPEASPLRKTLAICIARAVMIGYIPVIWGYSFPRQFKMGMEAARLGEGFWCSLHQIDLERQQQLVE